MRIRVWLTADHCATITFAQFYILARLGMLRASEPTERNER